MPAGLTMPAPVPGTTRAALATLPAVPLLSVGTWAASTGVFHVTREHLQAAIAAFADPGFRRPIVKLGHVDSRFDGEPALGRIVNPRLSDDGMTLIGDLTGMPSWLADIAASAFPSRSIEGEFGHKTQTGTRHAFALTAVALLGIQAPAVSTLADLAVLYGLDPVAVAASAAHSMEETMPQPPTPVRVAASVNLDTVRQEFYSDKNVTAFGPYAWIREVWSDFVIVDNDEGDLYQVPWSEDPAAPGEIVWGKPTSVRVQYVPDTSAEDADDQPLGMAASAGDALRAGALRARLAAMHVAAADGDTDPGPTPEVPADPEPPAAPAPADTTEPAEPDDEPDPAAAEPEQLALDVPAAEPEQPNTNEEGDTIMSLSEFRSRLGLGDDADEAAVLAALDDRLNTPAPQPVAATAALPDGVVAIEASTLDELRRNAEAGARAEARQRTEDRNRYIDDAVRAGKFAPARRDHWIAAYDADPTGTRQTIDGLAEGLVVPVAAKGVSGPSVEPDPNEPDVDAAKAWAAQLGISAEELTR